MKVPRCFVGTDARRHLSENIPGIQAFVHLHDRHAGRSLTFANGCGNRRSPAIFRQQGRMHVPTSPLREFEERFFQDLAVGDHNHQIGFLVADLTQGAGRIDVFRLVNLKMVPQGRLLDRGGQGFLGPPRRTVRLGDHGKHKVPVGRHQRFQAGHPERPGTGKKDPHAPRRRLRPVCGFSARPWWPEPG